MTAALLALALLSFRLQALASSPSGPPPRALPPAKGEAGVAGTAQRGSSPARAERRALVETALTYLGRPYRLGGQDPVTGVDCAGLVRLVFRRLGWDLPYTARGQMELGKRVRIESVSPADLVFFRNTSKRGTSHVGIYIGSGRFIHAAGRKRGVIVSSLSSPYYRRHFAGARSLLSPAPAAPALAGVGHDAPTASSR